MKKKGVFFLLFLMVFGKMIGVAVRATWGLFKVLMYIVFLPLIIVGMVFGGEMTVNVDTYKPPMRAETRAKYSISTNPKWRKKVAFKEWPI